MSVCWLVLCSAIGILLEKEAVTTRRPNAILCIKFNDHRSCKIFGCSVPPLQ